MLLFLAATNVWAAETCGSLINMSVILSVISVIFSSIFSVTSMDSLTDSAVEI